MKEAFELIRKRLEGIWRLQIRNGNARRTFYIPLQDALSIVSEVEAEYGNGKTNADHIRAMGDEELAEFLPIVSNMFCRPTDDCMKMICNRGECEKTKDCALNWLKSPTTD